MDRGHPEVRRPHAGFSLIELIIVVGLITLVAVIVVPNLQGRGIATRRAAAIDVLKEVVRQQARWYGERRTYASGLALLGYPGNAIYIGADGIAHAGADSESTYRIHLAAVGGSDRMHCQAGSGPSASTRFSYVVIADPQGFQAVDDRACGPICLYSTGEHGVGRDDADAALIDQCWAP